MGIRSAVLVLNLAATVFGHGYIKFIGVDNKLYPAWDGLQDDKLGAKRINFANSQSSNGRFAVTDQLSPDITCNENARAPALIADARAGSQLSFMWSPWLVSHKGPLITYMAPYEGDIATTNIQSFKFFKIHERGLLPDNKTWATDEMGWNRNVTSATIPHDIKPGKYIVRHELIAMHFATEDSVWKRAGEDLGPQHYVQCFNIDVSGTGTSIPAGNTFPGTYKHYRSEPGLYFDIYWGVTPYPIPGPPVYKPSTPAPVLKELKQEVVSPMGSMEGDILYFGNLFTEARERDAGILKLNQQRPKHGPLSNYTGPPEGSVPKGAVVLGPEMWYS